MKKRLVLEAPECCFAIEAENMIFPYEGALYTYQVQGVELRVRSRSLCHEAQIDSFFASLHETDMKTQSFQLLMMINTGVADIEVVGDKSLNTVLHEMGM